MAKTGTGSTQFGALVPASFTLGHRWYVCCVRPRHEFSAESELQERGFGAYVPKERRFKRSAFSIRRREKVEYPLFPGYCFVFFDVEKDEWWAPIHETDGVTGILAMNDIPSMVKTSTIERLQRAERAGAFDRTIPATNFREGQNVEIMEGPLTGLIAKIKSAKAKKRIQVVLNGLLVEVDASSLSTA